MDDLARLVFSNIQTPQGSYHVSSETDALFNKIMRIINTVTEERNSWAKELSKNKSSGYMERSVFVPKEYLKAIENKLNALQGQIKQAKVPYGFNYKTDTDIRTLTTDISLTGDNALSQAVKEAAAYGGRFDRRTGRLTLPVQSGMYEKITTGGTQQQYIEDKLKNAYKASRDTEQQREAVRREREADKIAREEAKQADRAAREEAKQIERATKEEAKREAKSKKLNAWFKSEGERAAAKEYQEKLDKSKQKEEDDKENKKENFLSSFLKDPLVKILTFFGLTVSLLRRIILNLPKQAIETAKEAQRSDAQTALALGLTKRQMRDFKIFEAAHDLDAGTFANAVKEVNETFGRIDKLENDSVQVRNMAKLGTAAYGAKGSGKANEFIQRLVTMDITQEQPDVLLAEIVNAATEAYNKRMNLTTMSSVDANGVPYSSEASMRSILSYLEEAGLQEAAVLFLQKIHDTESGYYGQIGDYASWLKSTRTNITGLSDTYLDALVIMGKAFNEIAAKLKDITDSTLTRFAVSLNKIADWINNQRWFLSPEENLMLNEKNIELNKKDAEMYKKMSDDLEGKIREKYKAVTGQEFNGDLLGRIPNMSLVAQDKELVDMLGLYATYKNRLDESNKQLEAGAKGKNVYYGATANTFPYLKIATDKRIGELQRYLEAETLALPNTTGAPVLPVKRGTLTPIQQELIERAFEKYKAATDISFVKPTGMEAAEYNRWLFDNPVTKAFIKQYNKAHNLKGENAISPANLYSGSLANRYMNNLQALQYAWMNMSTEDKASFIETIAARTGTDEGRLMLNAVKSTSNEMTKEASAKAVTQHFIEQWQQETDVASWLERTAPNKDYRISSAFVAQNATSRKSELRIVLVDTKGHEKVIPTGFVVDMTGEYTRNLSEVEMAY